jgi:hypothetical protein
MLLWPRLDRARISRLAHDPVRIAEIVEKRTSQPRDVILAMLTRGMPAAPAAAASATADQTRSDQKRVALRIVKSDESDSVSSPDPGTLLHA